VLRVPAHDASIATLSPVTDPTLASAFLERSRYYLCTEYPAKLARAIEVLPADRVWWRPNESVNSVGNLLLHLAGNVRQWIVSGVGGATDVRDRDAEFAARGGASGEELLARLADVLHEARAVLERLTPESLLEERAIQGRTPTVFEAVYHVVEHFSTHVGQVLWITKLVAPGALQLYEDAGGLARPTFLPEGQRDV
jgi:uncharacterized damage-inducible protein DinB